MSDLQALKAEKQALIDKMIQMQQQFIGREHQNGFSGRDYWAASAGPLLTYRQEYSDLASRVRGLAHQIIGSSSL
ncbi:hypothetical protein [uncultured Thiodictyon sp.]|uniref:hypothetical protein n=1 Tax=uncultured Thiodictyon sp. TaxID=1846217 RepID=UPI0025FB01CC|nr:hypothetical protein [uncultured Thiodictyon sp.]